MRGPDFGEIEVVASGGTFVTYRVRNFDLTNLNNCFMVPATGYSIGTLQLVDKTGTMSTGAVKVAVSNEPNAADLADHPDVAAAFAAAGTKTGFPLHHLYVGAYVSTAQAIKVEAYLTLRRILAAENVL